MRSVGQFPKGSVPGWRHQWNCDLLPLFHLQHSLSSLAFKAACQNISASPLLHFLLLLLLFLPYSISIPLWVMYAFIPPNNFIHLPIRVGGELFVTRPCRCKTERWEREREKERKKAKVGGSGRRVASGGTVREQNEMRWRCHFIKSDGCMCSGKTEHI